MSLFKKMKSPLSKDDLQEPKNLDSLNLLTMSEFLGKRNKSYRYYLLNSINP